MARRQKDSGKGSWSELMLFVVVIACVYLLLSLFGSSLTGETGQSWGKYLRETWGGAVIVLLLFGLYVGIAKFMRLRIPRLPRQVLGTLQLYISFAFMLGVLRESGWSSEMTLFLPGNIGSGLAKFFVLNIGTFISLILIVGSFMFSAYLYGAKILRMSMPKIPRLKFRIHRRKKHRPSPESDPEPARIEPEREDFYSDDIPENMPFPENMPDPILRQTPRSEISNDYDDPDYTPDISPTESLNNAARNFKVSGIQAIPKTSRAPRLKSGQKAVEMIDDAIALLDSGVPDFPRRKPKPSQPQQRTRKNRRPFPELTLSSGADTASQQETLSFSQTSHKTSQPLRTSRADNDAVFPPPAELFGERSRFDSSRDLHRDAGRQGVILLNTLRNFGISADIAQTIAGPSVTQYKLELASGTKISRISGLDEEIAMDLAVASVRIEAPILGTHYVGIEVPAPDRKIVSLRSMIESGEFINTSARLPIPLGVRTGGKILVKGLEEMPQVLIAGNEDSGRMTFVNSCIVSLCAGKTPEELKMILISPGSEVFSVYNGLPHLLAEPVRDIKTAHKALEWACTETDRRTANFSQEKAKNIEAYNRKVPKAKRIPEIVIVISELSELMYSAFNDFGDLVVKLARKAGGVGIYMLMATQKPSADVLPPQMRAAILARAAFSLTSETESKNVIDSSDAVKLTGKGDMLFVSTGSPVPARLQAPYIAEEKIFDFVDYMHSSLEPPELMTF